MIIKTIMFLILISRLIYLQIFSFKKYKNIAYINKILVLPLLPERGRIIGRGGIVLVNNKKSFRLLLNKGKYLSNKIILRHLQDVLSMDEDFFVYCLSKVKGVKNKSYITLINNLNWEQIATIEQNLDILDGIIIDVYYPRIYEYASLACHIIGYAKPTNTKNYELSDLNFSLFSDKSLDSWQDNSKNIEQNQSSGTIPDATAFSINDQVYEFDLKQLYEAEYDLSKSSINRSINTTLSEEQLVKNIGSINILVGNYGVERQYNDYLFGLVGYVEIEADAIGKHVKELSFSKPIGGKDLNLFLDIDLQKIIIDELPDKSCCIINNLEDNSILGMVSKPQFDPTVLSSNLNIQTWHSLQASGCLINRSTQGQYNPGSVFKLVTILSALENGIDPNFSWTCTSKPFLDKHFHCWNRFGHGRVNSMADAIAKSCNHYMFKIAKQLSIEKILATARKFGFGMKTNIDLPYESIGSIKYRDTQLSSLLMLSIGQGFITATPIQVAKMVSIIFNGGKYFKFKCADRNNIKSKSDILTMQAIEQYGNIKSIIGYDTESILDNSIRPIFDNSARKMVSKDLDSEITFGSIKDPALDIFNTDSLKLHSGLTNTIDKLNFYPNSEVEDKFTFFPKFPTATKDIIKDDHLNVLREGMYRAVNAPYGNSYKNRMQKGLLCGKTSTIQVVSRDKYSNKNKNHAMFAGYISHEDKNYGVTVFIENGLSGQNAASVAKKILSRYLGL